MQLTTGHDWSIQDFFAQSDEETDCNSGWGIHRPGVGIFLSTTKRMMRFWQKCQTCPFLASQKALTFC